MEIGLEYIKDRKQQKLLKHFLRQGFNQGKPREVRSLRTDPRIRYEGNGEYWTEYGFLIGTDYTDEQVQEIIDEMYERIYSLYDCTGRPFTRWIDWHRNPSGLISYRHYKGLDI